jgi:two-component system NtrC family sensor kinase
MGLINPIRNEVDCYSAECHFHKSGDALLGVLDVMVSMKNTDDTIATAIKNILINSVLITLLISGLSGIFIFYLVNKPLKKFEKAIAELGKGNLDYKISLRNKNEFSVIARQFNQMSGNLSLAYREIKDWSDKLNIKVEEKTSELKNVYDQIVQIEKLASLGKLSATVAHELNNPLEGILTYSKLISKKLKAENNENYTKLIGFTDLISEESARCGKIVKDLLLFSHSDEEIFVNSNAGEILDKSITLINHHLEINNIKLIKDYPENIYILCNPHKIQQAIMSLLINAIESMGAKGEGKIVVKLNLESGNAIIRITDEGTGISAKDLPYIFEPFYTTKDAMKGTGLGLSVVYGIINLHRGRIDVESTSASGTTFKISLPLNKNSFKENEIKA